MRSPIGEPSRKAADAYTSLAPGREVRIRVEIVKVSELVEMSNTVQWEVLTVTYSCSIPSTTGYPRSNSSGGHHILCTI